MNSDNTPSTSHAVENAWRHFEETVLPAVSADPPPATLALAQLSYYFGAMAMMELIARAMDTASSSRAVDLAMDRLWDEVAGFIEPSDGNLN
jgi:hypothetical protein